MVKIFWRFLLLIFIPCLVVGCGKRDGVKKQVFWPPTHCVQVPNVVQGLHFNLSFKSSHAMFLFYNRSATPILIDHVKPDPGASAGWSSLLHSGRWSLLALDRSGFLIKCSKVSSGHYSDVSCAKVLGLCYYEDNGKYTEMDSGWMGEDKSFKQINLLLSSNTIG